MDTSTRALSIIQGWLCTMYCCSFLMNSGMTLSITCFDFQFPNQLPILHVSFLSESDICIYKNGEIRWSSPSRITLICQNKPLMQNIYLSKTFYWSLAPVVT
jgi:hypothetical protein